MSTVVGTFTPTERHIARFEEWLDSYVDTVRAGWATKGVDVTTDEAKQALSLVRHSMTVPEREEWATPSEAVMAHAGLALHQAIHPGGQPASDEDNLIYRHALRTYKSLSRAERLDAIAAQLGVDPVNVERMLNGERVESDDEDGEDGEGETCLYRHYDADGVLLYAGISGDPAVRAKQHREKSPWYALAQQMTTEWFPTRREARQAEREAIAEERPLFNISNAPEGVKQLAIDYLLCRLAEKANR